MLEDLDKTLKELLTQELNRNKNEKDTRPEITFSVPNKEFTTIAHPATINLFLYDIRENLELRNNDWLLERQANGTALKYPPPVRVDCSYLITVWCADKELKDEHRFLGEVMKILMRYPKIPSRFLQGSLQGQEPPLRTSALQPPLSQNWAEFWQVMGGEPKAILNYTVTIAVDVQEPVEAGNLVEESIINYSQLGE